MDWLKIIASGLGLAEFWSKYFGDRQKESTGAKLQQGTDDHATLDEISAVSRPVGRDESEQLWIKNKSKYGQPVVTGDWNGE